MNPKRSRFEKKAYNKEKMKANDEKNKANFEEKATKPRVTSELMKDFPRPSSCRCNK